MFTPKLFISVGATGALYTLRETTYYYRGHDKIVTSFHHKNLSQDLDEAISKAEEYAKSQGLPLEYNKTVLDREMRDIHRSTKEEMERKRQELLERNKRDEEEAKIIRQQKIDAINCGIMPVGQYAGMKFEEIPTGYITWIVRNKDKLEGLFLEIATVLETYFVHLIFPEYNNSYFGNPKDKIEVVVTVDRVVALVNEYAPYGWPSVTYIVIMQEDVTKCKLIYKGSAFSPKEGEKFVLKATIKEHTLYKDEHQTIIQRPKIVGEAK